jgi:phospholipase/lecithinase/hemolysin
MSGLAVLALLAGIQPAGAQPTPTPPAFHTWAPAPPMGWNSWDAFGTTITEAQAKAQADYMAEHLRAYGWSLLTVDIQWYEPGAEGHNYRPDAPLVMDEFGRLLPAPNRFPSAADGAGFKPLADYAHARGLKFGIHLMRGIPRLAVTRNLPVKGTNVRASDIANRASVCAWNPDMYGVDMAKPGAQAYYDSVFELIASWGVDFVKVDDISRPYHDNEREIEAIRAAIDRTNRPIVLSLSPGETALDAADHAQRHANMWRISDDFWDQWRLLREQFTRLRNWNPHRGPGYWPDADMLPLGVLGKRTTRFTPDEQRTLMTLWCIARSPLIHGGDMTKTDAFTLSLLTNPEVIAVNQASTGNRPLFERDGLVAWIADVPGSRDRYLALFNTRDRGAETLAGVPVPVPLGDLGIDGSARVRDLWERRDLPVASGTLAPVVPWHGSALYRIGPVLPPAPTEPRVTRLFVFGDSYSDTGAGYVDGDGPTAVAYLARRLGFELKPSTRMSSSGDSLNFAVSGAQTGRGEGRTIKDALLGRGMADQVDDFVARVRAKQIVFAPASTLFYLAGGLNDRRLPSAETVANLQARIRTLYDAGARRFRVALLPTAIPQFSDVGLRLNTELAGIPDALRPQLPGANVALSRWGEYFDEVMRDPARFGIVNRTDKCAGRAVFGEDATPCATPSAYFFYHAGHPSTAVHKVVGDRLFDEIAAGARR